MKRADTPGMFSEIAERYDFLNHLFSLNIDRRWRRVLVREAEVRDGARVLDACTGTGDIAITFAGQCASSEVIGIDRSGEMLRIGERKLRKRKLNDRVKLLEGDVLALPFANASFDVVSIGFGFRNLPDYKKGISEMARVLKPGGRLFILEFAPPPDSLFGRSYHFYLQWLVPLAGGIISGSRAAYRYLSISIHDFLTNEQIRRLMEEGGLGKLRSMRLAKGVAFLHGGEKAF